MKSVKSLSMILALTMGSVAAGCAADSPGGDDDGGGGGGGGGGGDGEPTKPTDATGKYQLRSTFDLATNMPGTVGMVTKEFINATNDGDDPTLWILEKAIDALPNGLVKTALNASKGVVAAYLNPKVVDFAPDFVGTMIQVGNDFGQIATNFGLNETLEVTKGGTAYMSTHTVLGTHFKIDNIETDHAFADYHVDNFVIQNVGVGLETGGKLTIADHTVAVSYGKVLRIGLDGAIIPMIDPSAHDLKELLQHKVNCAAIGQAIYDYIDIGSAGLFATACTTGLGAASNLIYGKIADIDGTALEFKLNGTAKALDKNADGTIDTIQTGAWAGDIKYAGDPAPIAGATFYGSRM